jgi:hypothetical protein
MLAVKVVETAAGGDSSERVLSMEIVLLQKPRQKINGKELWRQLLVSTADS